MFDHIVYVSVFLFHSAMAGNKSLIVLCSKYCFQVGYFALLLMASVSCSIRAYCYTTREQIKWLL